MCRTGEQWTKIRSDNRKHPKFMLFSLRLEFLAKPLQSIPIGVLLIIFRQTTTWIIIDIYFTKHII